MTQRLLMFRELADHGVPFTRTHLDRLEKDDKFPKRVAIGEFRVGWREDEIDAWVKVKIQARSKVSGRLGSSGQTKKKRGDDAPRDDAA